MLLFYKPIQGSSRSRHSCMFQSMFDALIRWSAYLISRLEALPFSGMNTKAAPHPYVSCYDWHGHLLQIIVLFYMVYLITLKICLHWLSSRVRYGHSLEGSAPFLMILLILPFNVFLRRLQSFRQKSDRGSDAFQKGVL